MTSSPVHRARDCQIRRSRGNEVLISMCKWRGQTVATEAPTMHTSPFCVILRNIPLSLLAFTSAWIFEASALHNTPHAIDSLTNSASAPGCISRAQRATPPSCQHTVCSCFSASSGPTRSVKWMKPKICRQSPTFDCTSIAVRHDATRAF